MRLIFIRHGEPDYERDTLTEKGWKEAACLAKRTKTWQVTDCYVSPLGRAKDTARDTLAAWGMEEQLLPWLREYKARISDPKDPGKETIPWDFLPEYWTKESAMFSSEDWIETPLMKSGAGNVKSVYEETIKGLDDLLAQYGYERDGKLYRTKKEPEREKEEITLVLFCHMGITCVMLSHLLNIPFPLLIHGFFMAPSSVTVLAAEEREPGTAYFRCQMLGDTSHLKAEGEPVSHMGYFTSPFQG